MKPSVSSLLGLNLIMYIIVVIIAGWAINYGIDNTYIKASAEPLPAHLFPIYYPMGNKATGLFVLFALIAGVVGIGSLISGMLSMMKEWDLNNLALASSSAIVTWGLTLLAMGLACKEINIGGRNETLWTLEAFVIILSATQLFYIGAVNAEMPQSTVHWP
ncbi:hypothetical protein AMTRI_Chr01g114540 [Amborella trichopoda]|uniref:AWPM-19-like family protein n=1 Tax=Amborella trichopoda TaxID=13333 RepID=W1PW89_AMBTC|nr:uncharacterized protein LOC18440616 [Amborella trichopoda]ERN12398.1 hypothetical protein AMTR_s00025p00122690 [Amborella trichopoda]|eukprot:XP_006850817.1 uncharacterized protein LOC18440616 [Amborella trichopoda]